MKSSRASEKFALSTPTRRASFACNSFSLLLARIRAMRLKRTSLDVRRQGPNERSAHNLSAQNLAAKYGYIWLAKVTKQGPPCANVATRFDSAQVFPDGRQSGLDSSEGKCPVKNITIRSDEGISEIVRSSELQRLKEGAHVYDSLPSTFGELHPAFPKDAWFLPAPTRHWSNNLSE